LTVSTNPSSPFVPLQNISILLDVDDNDMADMKINFLKYSQDHINWNSILEGPLDYETNHTVNWTVSPFPGDYYLFAEVEDNEGNLGHYVLNFTINEASVDQSVVYLDYNLNNSLVFNRFVQFDINADSVLEWTDWLNSSDAYLILDRNSNGEVDDINDFARLFELRNGAGSNNIIDGQDSMFNVLKIWIDSGNSANEAVVDTGELKSLSDANIINITVDPCCSFMKW